MRFVFLSVAGSIAHDQRAQRTGSAHCHIQEERRSSNGGISFCNTFGVGPLGVESRSEAREFHEA